MSSTTAPEPELVAVPSLAALAAANREQKRTELEAFVRDLEIARDSAR